MRLTRIPLRRVAATLAASTLIAGGLLSGSAAQAAPAPHTSPEAATALAERLGDRSAGTYLDATTGRMVVTVTDEAAAKTVRAAGGVARIVLRGGDDLAAVTSSLEQSARIPGTAWFVDPIANQVVVEVDSTVVGAALDAVRVAVRPYGEAARIQSTPGTLSTTISGGQAIYGGGARCSLGFNVRSNSSGLDYFLTAGHCTNIASTWYANSSRTTLLGPRVVTSFPGNDYGIVRYDGSISRPGNVSLFNGTFRDITNAANAVVGQSVQRSGSTTGVRSGTVTALNATVNYAQGSVTGMIRTTVCAEQGDSGGALFSGNTALGLTSGGSGNCSVGGTTFFQPVTEPLNQFGLSVY